MKMNVEADANQNSTDITCHCCCWSYFCTVWLLAVTESHAPGCNY